MSDIPASVQNEHTRYRPGQLLYTIANGPHPPPDMLIPGDGLPAFTMRRQMAQLLANLQLPYPIGPYTTPDTAKIGLHDKEQFTPEDGSQYRHAGFHIVELPSGELRILDRTKLVPQTSPSAMLRSARLRTRGAWLTKAVEPATREPLATRLRKSGSSDWMTSLIKHHYLTKHEGHAKTIGGFVGGDNEYQRLHREHHASGKADHDHRGGVLKSMRGKGQLLLKELTPNFQ